MKIEMIFLLGAVGALAPEIVRLYNLRQQPAGSFSIFYLIASLAFAALGGLVAVILPATTPLAAFYAGISTPLVVNSALRQAVNHKPGGLRDASSSGAPAASPLRRFIAAI